MTDVAGSQVNALEMQHISKEKEVKSLRQQLLDFQVQSDEKTIIGTLVFFSHCIISLLEWVSHFRRKVRRKSEKIQNCRC